MIKKNIYKVIIFPIGFLLFGDFSSIIFCDDIDPTSIKENNEENSKNTFQALMFFISINIFLYFLRNGFPISFSGNESLDMASKITESAVNITASSQDTINSLQTQVAETNDINSNLRNLLESRDTKIAHLQQQNDVLQQNFQASEMYNRDLRTFIRSLGENDPRIKEKATQFYRNYGPHGRP
jgi:hypothetical protein